MVRPWFFHTLSYKRSKLEQAFLIRKVISWSNIASFASVLPSYTKVRTSFNETLPILKLVSWLTDSSRGGLWCITSVLLKLIVNPKSLTASAKWLHNSCKSASVCAHSAQSSAHKGDPALVPPGPWQMPSKVEDWKAFQRCGTVCILPPLIWTWLPSALQHGIGWRGKVPTCSLVWDRWQRERLLRDCRSPIPFRAYFMKRSSWNLADNQFSPAVTRWDFCQLSRMPLWGRKTQSKNADSDLGTSPESFLS